MNQDQTSTYMEAGADGSLLMPLRKWDETATKPDKDGKPKIIKLGKHPLGKDWPSAIYPLEKIKQRAAAGHNVGYRIPPGQLVVDMDPRNYKRDGKTAEQAQDLVAEALGVFDFDEVLADFPTVKTGGDGYHVYVKVGNDVDLKTWKEKAPGWTSVEFKKPGKYVVCAGSKHPDVGKEYKWVNGLRLRDCKELESSVAQGLGELLKKGAQSSSGEGESAWYASIFSPYELKTEALDKLDVTEFRDRERWLNVCFASHHATGGLGEEEFVEWSLSDPVFEHEEVNARKAWESTSIKGSGGGCTDARHLMTLLTGAKVDTQHTLFSRRLDTVKSQHEFDGLAISEDDPFLQKAKKIVEETEVGEELRTPPGDALKMAQSMAPGASPEDKLLVARLIRGAPMAEALEAEEVLAKQKVMTAKETKKRLTAIEAKVQDNISELLSKKTIKEVFNEGKHILVEPDGQVWVYREGDLITEGSRWIPISDDYLGRIVYVMLDTLKCEELVLKRDEVYIVKSAIMAIRMRRAQHKAMIHDATRTLPMLNVRNGEVWILANGGYELRTPSYASYSTYCLDVKYDEWAESPLHDQTEQEIWRDFPDTDDLIRHIGEVQGYMIQPNKPDPNWYIYHGPGGDGKSLMIDIMDGMIGPALLKTDINILSIGSQNRDRFADSALVGKLVVAIEEIPRKHTLNDAGLKLLAGNNKVSTRNAHGKTWYDFKYIGTLVMCTNHYPRMQSVDGGIMRRANVMPYNRSFVKHGEADLNRAKDILSDEGEKSGILNKWLAGNKRYSERGHFIDPHSCVMAKQELLGATSNMIRFVRDCIVKDKPTKLLAEAKELYDLYGAWCAKNGQTDDVLSRQDCNLTLSNLGFTVKKRGGNKTKIYGGTLSTDVAGVEMAEMADFDGME